MKIEVFHKQEIEQAIATGLLIEMLGDKLESFTSICKDSIPTNGSHTAPLAKLNQTELFKTMQSIVLHRCGDFTVKTDILNIRFWLKPDYALLWLAHKDKKHVMNKMVNEKYHCDDLY